LTILSILPDLSDTSLKKKYGINIRINPSSG